MDEILGYSVVIGGGDGSSSTYFYKTKEEAQKHLDWEEENIGYLECGDDISEVKMSDFADKFEAPW